MVNQNRKENHAGEVGSPAMKYHAVNNNRDEESSIDRVVATNDASGLKPSGGSGADIPTMKTRKTLMRIGTWNHAILHHDNARPHTSRQTEKALHKMSFVLLPHPSYSPDLAPSDFYLFPKLKEHLRGNHYENDEDMEAAVRHRFGQKCVGFFTDGMRQLVRRWQLCTYDIADTLIINLIPFVFVYL
ncbi:histone-lysine N-methyltransferase SETMAR [Elysia marginata]|uniref:Histone-lysine N-methyltransferase SETMAR n=1 Tax=Elysia marginata TaxID=1093978 RepID=A0AAV4HQ13_9GAST|nr:histone-lysine N-methyltransferase SETMAR [Elysia marginata]